MRVSARMPRRPVGLGVAVASVPLPCRRCSGRETCGGRMSAVLMMDVDRRGGMCLVGSRYVVRTVRAAALLALAVALCAPAPASAQSGQHVAVVINESSPDSVQVGEHYIRQRGIPPANVIRIRTAPREVIERSTFRR